jgi:hypothetical protein
MTWLTWRQHRWEAAIGGLLLGLLTAAMVTSKVRLDGIAHQLQVEECPGRFVGTLNGMVRGSVARGLSCQTLTMQLNQHLSSTTLYLYLAVLVLPALVGLFVGAPLLAREFEHGTHRLVWTQGITRLRWLATKLGLLLSAAALGGGIAALLGVWYRATADIDTTAFRGFDAQGPVLVAYVLFAVALAITAGALIRRTLPAILVTLVCFVGARISIALWLRPRFLPPLVDDSDRVSAKDWYLTYGGYVDRQGHPLSPNQVGEVFRGCLGSPPAQVTKTQAGECLRSAGVFQHSLYQSADRFWLFQSIEAAIFLALAAALIALTIWWVRRRPA